MAKTVQPIDIKLGIKGGEQLGKLSSAFRDLGKTVGQADAGLEEARKSIIEYGKTANQSEALIRGQIKAFEGLQKQAELGGKVFTQLENDIKALGGVLYGASAAVEAKRKSLVNLGSSANATTTQIQSAIKALTALRGETRLDSEAFNTFGQSIDRLAERFEKVNQEAQDFANAQARSGRAISASSGAAKQQIKDLDLVAQALREQREELGRLEGEARIRRGVADLAERGAVSSGRRSYQEALAESVLSGTSLRKLLSTKDIRAALAEVELQIAEFQKQVESKLSRGLQISFQETSRAARESARAMAAAFADPEFLGILDRLDQRIGELPNTTAGFNQRLRELQQQLANTTRDSDAYVLVSLKIARVQREAAAATQGLGAALVRDLNTGVAARSSKNLREAIGQLQSEMNELDVQTAEGSRRYAENANQVRNLETQLRQLGDSYRHVSDMAQQAAAAQGVYANTATARNYLNRAMVRAQEAAGAQLAEAVRAGVAATPLMLPAAGGTTAPGTGALRSGMAQEYIPTESRIGGRLGETPGQPSRGMIGDVQAISARRSIGPQATEEQIDRARRAHISRGEAIRAETEAKEAAARVEQGLRKEIDLARKAYNGSINSTNNLRGAIDRYRSTLPSASEEFEQLTREIIDLDRKSEAVSRRMGRRRMSPMQMTQAAGAAISGGIFGGPEGFLGGVGGALVGGVGGAFAGAAIGAQVGGLRRQLGEFADYAAGIQKLQIALRGAAGSQDEFNRAMAAASAATAQLNVPQDVAVRNMTRLTAAVEGAGGQVSDAEIVFRNVSSAIKATGGSAQDVDSAITAMVQVFSKGKVSAEELSGQLGERLPGAVTMFAKANKMTLPELQKALKDGTVGLNELMNFIIELGNKYDGTAKKIAGSSEEAGARLQVAYNQMRIDVGKALQPVGAEFQDAFAEFIKEITPALVVSLPKIAKAFAQIGRVVLDVSRAIAGAFGGMFAELQSQSETAVTNINSLFKGIGEFFSKIAKFMSQQWQFRIGEIILNASGGNAQVKKIIESLGEFWKQTVDFMGRYWGKFVEYAVNAFAGALTGPVQVILQKAGINLGQVAASFVSGFGGGPSSPKAQKDEYSLPENVSDFLGPTPDSSSGGSGGKAARDAEQIEQQLAQIQLQEEEIERSKVLFAVNEEIKNTARQIVLAQSNGNMQKAYGLQQDQKSLEFIRRDLEIQLNYQKAVDAANLEKDAAVRAAKLRLAESQRLFGVEENINNALIDRIDLIQQNTLAIKDQAKALGDARFGLREQLGMVDPKERVARAQEEFRKQYPGATAEDLDLIRRQIDPTPFESMRQNISRLKKELKELVDPVNQITGAANAIGTSFADSFKSVISGSATAQEALAGFFKNIANYFLDMAAQIIQKWITMAILNTALKLFPGRSGGGGGDIFADIASRGGLRFAKGGIMTEDGPMPLRTYARGGIARSPQLAMFGEGSMPEAYVPLPDGRSIPVTMRGSAGVQVDAINITIENTGDQLTPAAQKQLAGQVQGIVLSTLANERRSGGML